MNLHTYLQYAAVTSPIVLAIIFAALTFKSWLDRVSFRRNTTFAAQLQLSTFTEMFSDSDEESYDDAMDRVPGLHTVTPIK